MLTAIVASVAIIELVVIFVLLEALHIAEQERRDVMKWVAKREILRKFHEDNQ